MAALDLSWQLRTLWRRLDSRVVAILSGWAGPFQLNRKLRMLWLRSDSRVATVLTQCGVCERVGVPLEPEASYDVASFRQSRCCNTQCGVGGRGRSS